MDPRTASHKALLDVVTNKDQDRAQALLLEGVSSNSTDPELDAPLYRAARICSVAIVKLLLENGAKVNFVDERGCTAVAVACAEGSVDTVSALLEAGADVNLPNAVGKTPLITAATEGDARIVKLLLDNGADPMITDKMGRTPAEMAKKYAHTEVLELFPEEARPALTLEEIMANFNKAALSATSTPPPTQTPPPEASPEDIPQDPSSDPQRDTTVQEAEGSHGTTQPTAENSGGESTGCAATDIDPTAQDKGQLPGAEAPPPTPAQVHSGSERDTPVSTVTVEAADEPTDANQVQAQAEASGSTVDTAGVDSTDTHIARADSRASVGGLSTTSSVDEIMRALDARAAEISNERKKSERDIGGNDAKCYDCVALEILRDDYKALVLDNEQLTRENERMKQQMEALVTANKQLEQDMAAMKKDAWYTWVIFLLWAVCVCLCCCVGAHVNLHPIVPGFDAVMNYTEFVQEQVTMLL